jgi:hypothetical protein
MNSAEIRQAELLGRWPDDDAVQIAAKQSG